MNIHIFDLSSEALSSNGNIFCQVVGSYPTKNIIGKTKAIQSSNKIKWDESFIINDIFIKNVKFIIYSESIIEGRSLICDFSYQISSLSWSNKNDGKITLENKEKNLKLTISVTKTQKSIFLQNNINENENQNKFEVSDFLSFSIVSKEIHQIALIHVSDDQKTVQISCPHFSYLKSIFFQSNGNKSSSLIDIHKTFPSFQFFFIAIQLLKSENNQNENESIEISFFINSNYKQVFIKKINNVVSENLYVPVFFSFTKNNESTFCEIVSIDQLFEKVAIQNIYHQEVIGKILKSKNLSVEKIYNGILFTGNLPLSEDLKTLRIFLKHSSNEKVDISLSSINDDGSLDDTCFFNRPAIANKTIRLSTNKYHTYASFSMIDFDNLPPKISSIVIALTSFIGKPLSKVNSIEIALTDLNENLITSIPIAIDDDLPGFVVGAIQRNGKKWELKYAGYPCDCKVPNLAAKAFLSSCSPVDEDVIEWRDDV